MDGILCLGKYCVQLTNVINEMKENKELIMTVKNSPFRARVLRKEKNSGPEVKLSLQVESDDVLTFPKESLHMTESLYYNPQVLTEMLLDLCIYFC